MAASYYATYCRFSTVDKRAGAILMSSDGIVGDVMDIEIDASDTTRAWLVTRFGARLGYLDADMTEQVRLAHARGMEAKAILASAYLDNSIESKYWGEVVVMCFTQNTAYQNFLHTVSRALADGKRPTVDLGKGGLAQVENSSGSWLPETRVPALKTAEGVALLKDHATINDRLVEGARQRKPGCMVAGYTFIALLIAAVVWIVWKLFF